MALLYQINVASSSILPPDTLTSFSTTYCTMHPHYSQQNNPLIVNDDSLTT